MGAQTPWFLTQSPGGNDGRDDNGINLQPSRSTGHLRLLQMNADLYFSVSDDASVVGKLLLQHERESLSATHCRVGGVG